MAVKLYYQDMLGVNYCYVLKIRTDATNLHIKCYEDIIRNFIIINFPQVKLIDYIDFNGIDFGERVLDIEIELLNILTVF